MRSRFRSDDGANAVEFALVLPILVILLFGIFIVGMAYDVKLVANHAGRDAARFAATLPFEDDGSGGMDEDWFVDVRNRALEAGEGQFGSPAAGVRDDAAVCVAFNDGSTWRKHRWVGSTHETPADGPTSYCFEDDLSKERVQVVLERDAAFNLVLLPPDTLRLTSNAVAKFENLEEAP